MVQPGNGNWTQMNADFADKASRSGERNLTLGVSFFTGIDSFFHLIRVYPILSASNMISLG